MNIQNNDLNSNNEKSQGINFIEILQYLLRKWYWFVLSIVIFVGYAYYNYSRTQYIYSSSATVMIKDPSGNNSVALDRLNQYSVANVSNEILQFKSFHLMKDVVKRLHANVNYGIYDGLRYEELYTQAPISVNFLDTLNNNTLSLKVIPIGADKILIDDYKDENSNPREFSLNKIIQTPKGRIIVNRTLNYNNKWFEKIIYVNKMPVDATANSYLNRLSIVQAQNDANVLNISINDYSTVRADDIINTLIAIYNEQNIKDKNMIAINTTNFINERLEVIGKELGGVESELETYKKANQIIDPTTNANLYLGSSKENNDASHELETQLRLAQYIRNYLVNPSKSIELIPSNTGLANIDIETQINTYNANKLKRDKLIEDSSDKNPIVLEINKFLNSMHQNIIRAVDNYIVGINMRLMNVRNQHATAQMMIAQVPTQQRHMLSIERQQKIKEELYLYLLNKREESQLSEVMSSNSARVIDEATGNSTPISPIISKVIGMGAVESLIIPFVILSLIRIFDTRINGRKDIENETSIPFLGEIPEDPALKKMNKNDYVVIKEGRDIVSEAFRIIRTNMDYMRVSSKKMQVITFTSFNEGSGKTFVSTNLAYSFAQTKKRVILIDLDIRKGTLSSKIHNVKKGITSFLSGNSTLEEIIVHDEAHPNLDFIPAGHIAPNPAELLVSDELDKMIVELKKEYDYIIVDNVPIGIVADATISNRIADLTIFIVRVGKLNKRMIPELEKIYRSGKLRNMSLLLNSVELSKHAHGYNYGYGYGYGYGYNKKEA